VRPAAAARDAQGARVVLCCYLDAAWTGRRKDARSYHPYGPHPGLIKADGDLVAEQLANVCNEWKADITVAGLAFAGPTLENIREPPSGSGIQWTVA
jgi:hypothetical protein